MHEVSARRAAALIGITAAHQVRRTRDGPPSRLSQVISRPDTGWWLDAPVDALRGHRDDDHAASTATSKRPGESATTSATPHSAQVAAYLGSGDRGWPTSGNSAATPTAAPSAIQGLDPIPGTLSYTPSHEIAKGPH